MSPTSDTLEVLLPGVPEPLLKRARSVVQCLRLLAADARPSRALSVGVGLDRARSELESQERARLGAALRDLLRHYLAALAPSDTFHSWGDAAVGHGEAWRVLEEFREEHPWLAGIPAPGSTAGVTAARLMESAERLGLPADETATWRARLLRFTEGARVAEARVRARFEERSSERGHSPEGESGLGACLVESLLDRGAVREARAWFQEQAALTASDPRLRQLLSWTLLCSGDYAGAKSAILGAPVFAGMLPACLGDLRAERPEWLPCLAGRTASNESVPAADLLPESRDRGDVGAAALGVFAIGSAGETAAVHVDVAPGLRAGLDAWVADRDGAYAVPGESEHEMVIGARPVTIRKEGDLPIRGALGRERTLALALAPILDDHGEVAGWLHLECEHHRLPSRARLTAMAAAWRSEVLARCCPATRVLRRELETGDATWTRMESPSSRPCAAIFEGLVADLGIKTAQRKWWGFLADGDELHLVASGGDAAGLSTSGMRGQGRALTRAAATRSLVSFDAPDARLSLDDQAASGVVLPLAVGGSLCGLLAIESSRRRDFRDGDLARIASLSDTRGCALRIARFVDWHRQRFGFEVWFDAERAGFRSFAARLYAAARTSSPVVFVGPGGSGKTVLARWLHFESHRSEGPLRFVDCESLSDRIDLRRRLEAATGGSLVLEGLDRLGTECQEQLLRRIEGDEESEDWDPAEVRILGTSRSPLGTDPSTASVPSGPTMREDLARRLDRVQIRLSPLRDRRGDILTLVAGFAKRFAEEESVRTPTFSDETLALLWRQPWEGNARELENFVYKLVVFGPGRKRGAPEILQPEHVHEIAAQFSLRLTNRLPSRHPSRADLLAALRITRKPGGRLNKTRAALYLGWDPDTLVARMQDAGIGEDLASVSEDEGWRVDTNRAIDASAAARIDDAADPSEDAPAIVAPAGGLRPGSPNPDPSNARVAPSASAEQTLMPDPEGRSE